MFQNLFVFVSDSDEATATAGEFSLQTASGNIGGGYTLRLFVDMQETVCCVC